MKFSNVSMKRYRSTTLALALAMSVSTAYSLTMDMVDIGYVNNPGMVSNAWAPYTPGSVSYRYKIGVYEVTQGQYVEFLNDVAASDPYGLWGNWGISRSGSDGNYTYSTTDPNLPAVKVNIYGAMRFANWLTTGDTETGVYELGGVALPAVGSITRNMTAYQNGGFAIPSMDEWYKAAYYQPASLGGDTDSYWDYATNSNTPPSGLEANYLSGDNLNPGVMVDVGYSIASFSGTYDMTGNAWEYSDTVLPELPDWYLNFGGSYQKTGTESYALTAGLSPPNLYQQTLGFRVVQFDQVPEPETYALGIASCALLMAVMLRRRTGR